MSNAVAEIKPNEKKESETVPLASGEWFAEPPRHEESGGLPEWYRDLQTESWHTYLETPDPHRKDENWRFANIRHVKFGTLQVAEPVSDPDAVIAQTEKRGLQSISARFVFANNRLIHSKSFFLPEGVICLPIQEALASHGDLVRKHFMQEEARLGGAKFAALHGAASLSGMFIHVPKNVVVKAPIEIDHWAGGENATIFPHVLITAENGASVSVVERFRSLNDTDATLSVGICDLAPEAGGAIQYVAIQHYNDHSKHVQLNGTRVGRDARAKSCFINLGGAWVRNESVSRLTDTGADSLMLSANLADGNQEFDQRTLQRHEAQHTTSDLLYKNALYHQSRTIFAGLIQVCPGAHDTDAFQSCRNLLGSNEAEANSMPGLEIDADQVRCSHGSTSGQISDEEIFYLKARGIRPKIARQMISFGFLNEAVARLDGEELREMIGERFQERFAVLA
jgi:Fe-S cluster assembly protein SufD